MVCGIILQQRDMTIPLQQPQQMGIGATRGQYHKEQEKDGWSMMEIVYSFLE